MSLKNHFKKHKTIYTLIVSGFLLLLTYVWYAVIPECVGFSLPTGGWDWLSFYGMLVSVGFAVWGIRKQIDHAHRETLESQQLSVLPYLDTTLLFGIKSNVHNLSLRVFRDSDGKLINEGYSIPQSTNSPSYATFNWENAITIRVMNTGLSTACQISVFLYQLDEVRGLSSLDSIDKKPIEDFYDKISISNFQFYEFLNHPPHNYDWLISPQYNLCTGDGYFNLALDCSKILQTYHTILEFRFTDVYQNIYYQRMYLRFGKAGYGFLPISKVYSKNVKK